MKLPSNECTIAAGKGAQVLDRVAGMPNDSGPGIFAGDSSNWHATGELLIRIAEVAACPRPLIPYPGWRFDIDWDNADPAFQIRQQIWSYFRGRKEAAVRVKWHHGLWLNLWLGNDLSKQLFIAGCDEPNEMAFVDRFLKPGMVFLDAGANDGIYTLLASARVSASGRVYAFEPSSREFSRLSQNLAMNSISNVKAFSIALSDSDGKLELNIADGEHAGQNTLGGFAYEIASAGKERVTTRRLDNVLREQGVERLDLVKIDIEGAELKLLQGAAQMLRERPPVLLFEVSEPSLRNMGASGAELLAFVRSFGYDIYIFDTHTGMPVLARQGELTSNMVAAPLGVPIAL